MVKIRHLGYVSIKNGIISLTLNNKKLFQEKLSELVGKDIEIIIKEQKGKRSLNANSLYWKWMTIMGEDLGYSKEALHFVFKKQFLSEKMPAFSRDEFMEYLQGLDKEIANTRKLNTKEMSKYMDSVYEQARELNINLPLPEFRGLTDEP